MKNLKEVPSGTKIKIKNDGYLPFNIILIKKKRTKNN